MMRDFEIGDDALYDGNEPVRVVAFYDAETYVVAFLDEDGEIEDTKNVLSYSLRPTDDPIDPDKYSPNYYW